MSDAGPAGMRTRGTAILLVASAAAVLLTYWGTLHADLMLDDYIALRPRATAELWQVWHGTWEPRGLWPVFYRPLSIWYYALLFHLFGLASLPLRVLTLIELTTAAWGVGLFVQRESASLGLGLFGALLFAVHPGLAHAGVAFIFLQNHLVSALVAVSVLILWQARRTTPTLRAWWPIAALILAGSLVKEDVLVLAPVIVALQVVRARLEHDVPMPGRAMVMAMVTGAVGFFVLRWGLLGALGGFWDRPDVTVVIRNLVRGAFRTLVEFRGVYFENDWTLRSASMASCAWLLAGVVALRCKRGHDRGLWIIALVLLIGVSAPLALMSNMWRYHLVSLAATLLVVAAVGSVMRAVPRVGARHAAIACAGVTLAAMALASRTILAPLGPCGPSTMALDREVRGWRAPLTDADRGIVSWAIPQEELNWIDAKAEACRAGTVPRLTKMMDHITWNLDPSSFTSLVTARARAVRVAFRDPAASAAAPSVVHVRADGREVATVPVTSPDWRDVVVVLRSGWLDRLRGMYRIDARLDSSDAHPRPLELGAIRIQ